MRFVGTGVLLLGLLASAPESLPKVVEAGASNRGASPVDPKALRARLPRAKPDGAGRVFFPAERFWVESPMALILRSWVQTGPRKEQGVARFAFELPSAGEWVLAGKVRAPNGESDSVLLSIDSESNEIVWDARPNAGFTWEWARERTDSKPDLSSRKTWNLEAGLHQLRLRTLEPGFAFEKLALFPVAMTSNAKNPDGLVK